MSQSISVFPLFLSLHICITHQCCPLDAQHTTPARQTHTSPYPHPHPAIPFPPKPFPLPRSFLLSHTEISSKLQIHHNDNRIVGFTHTHTHTPTTSQKTLTLLSPTPRPPLSDNGGEGEVWGSFAGVTFFLPLLFSRHLLLLLLLLNRFVRRPCLLTRERPPSFPFIRSFLNRQRKTIGASTPHPFSRQAGIFLRPPPPPSVPSFSLSLSAMKQAC